VAGVRHGDSCPPVPAASHASLTCRLGSHASRCSDRFPLSDPCLRGSAAVWAFTSDASAVAHGLMGIIDILVDLTELDRPVIEQVFDI